MEVLKVAYSLNKTGRFSKCRSIAAMLQLVQNTVCLQDSNVTPLWKYSCLYCIKTYCQVNAAFSDS